MSTFRAGRQPLTLLRRWFTIFLGTLRERGSMATHTANLYLLEDLEDSSKTRDLADSDLGALRAVADWIETFVVKPHKDLGRAGTVCPFVPRSLERKVLWLAAEQIADRDERDAIELVSSYRGLFLETQPTGGEDVDYKVIVVVFPDLPADRAKAVFEKVQQNLAVPSYADDRNLVRAVLRRERRPCDLQPEFPTIPIARAVSVRETYRRQRLEVLSAQRGDAQHLGASLWRVRSPGPGGGATRLAVEREAD